MYAEALAASVRGHHPRARVTLLDPSRDLAAEVGRLRPHLVVANRVPPGVRGAVASWVEVAVPVGGGGPKGLAAEISTGGSSRGVENLSTGDVLATLDLEPTGRPPTWAPERPVVADGGYSPECVEGAFPELRA